MIKGMSSLKIGTGTAGCAHKREHSITSWAPCPEHLVPKSGVKPIAEAIRKGIRSCTRVQNTTNSFCDGKSAAKASGTRMRQQGACLQAGTGSSLWTWSIGWNSNNTSTTLRPDIIVVSKTTKNILIMELKVPREDCLGEAHERKRTKYEHLVISFWEHGCKVKCMPIVVGCRGFGAQSVHRALSVLGSAWEVRASQSHQGLQRRSRESLEMTLDPDRRSMGTNEWHLNTHTATWSTVGGGGEGGVGGLLEGVWRCKTQNT